MSGRTPHPDVAVTEVAWESAPLRALCFPFKVRTNIDGIGGFLAEMLAPLVAADPKAATSTVSLDDRGEGHPDRYAACVDGEVIHETAEAANLIAALAWIVNRRAVAGTCGHLILHAGAVQFGERAVLAVGAMSSGKSTLVTGLVSGGAAYLTDEAVAVDATAGIVTPYPKAVTLDHGSWPLFPDLRPDLPDMLEPQQHVSWQVAPERIRPGCVGTACAPALVVLPQYRADAPPATVTPVAPRDLVLALAEQSFNFADLGKVGFETAVWIARRCPAISIVHSDLDAACAAVLDAVEATEP